MEGLLKTQTFVCSCFFTHNFYIKRYNLHVVFYDRNQFQENYMKILRNKGCVTEKQFQEVLTEIENEASRRRNLGEASLSRRREIKEKYVPRHREVYELQDKFLHPEFLSLVAEAKTSTATVESLLLRMSSMGQEVYSFPLFTQQFCRLVLEELEHIEHSACHKGRPNTMNKHGVLLNEFGFNKGLLKPLRRQYLSPITALLYPVWGGGCLDSHKAFSVTYDMGHDLDLGCHYDNAEVTLNVCLGDVFTGGRLYILPMQSDVDTAKSTNSIKCMHYPGWGVLHRGRQRHGAEKLVSGKRCNLIMWLRSSSVRNKHCPMCRGVPKLMQVPGLDDGFRISDSGGNQSEESVDACRAV
ncbi:2-oxoglutarate and iron-dependent oxygenase domain-containing protein 2-like [Littorina saxatilis]|uniref:Fe2OG dioxygenase domain-containing protein n=1 Tax=Littorina saxatilis TaxID=31220 RepID=A0AAN9AHW5_9CAEN